MKIKGSEIHTGMVFQWDGRLVKVVANEFANADNGPRMNHVKMRDVATGATFQNRFDSSVKVTSMEVRQIPCLYLYSEGDTLIFMDNSNYEHIRIDKAVLGDKALFLQDNMEVIVHTANDVPFSVDIPKRVICTIKDTIPKKSEKFSGASPNHVILDNGVEIKEVPSHIAIGDKIAVDTETLSYVGRGNLSR